MGLTALARAGIEEQRRRQAAAGRIAPTLFATMTGGFLDPRNVTKAFQRELATAGLPPMRFHDLRHCYATLMLAAGVPLRVIQASLGHTSIATTAAIYAHVLPELNRQSAERFDDLFTGRTEG